MSDSNILVVEDEKIVAKHLQNVLRKLGYTVERTASSGEEALAVAAECQPDLVLMDIVLEGAIDGVEAADRIRRELSIPVIFLTAHSDKNILDRAKLVEPAGYLIKPFSEDEVRTTVEMGLYKSAIEKRLRTSERRYRQMFENNPAVQLLIDPSTGRIVDANSASSRFYGYSVEQLRNMDVSRITTIEDYGMNQSMNTDDSTRTQYFAFRHRLASGEEREVEVHSGPLEMDGKTVLYWIVHDVTEKRRAENLLLQAERVKAVGELAHGVAHNFNNLLQVVVGAAQLSIAQVESGKTDEAVAHLNLILETSRNGAELVRRLGEFARVGKTERKEKGKVFDLSRTVEAALEMSEMWWKTEPSGGRRRIQLHKKLTPGCMVRGKENSMFQVVMNLARNAVEALPDGGDISIETSVSEGYISLVVSDNGTGIPEEDIPRIFEPFWTSKGFQRAGLGLSSSYGIIQSLGGTILVDSEPEVGSTFTVVLPVAQHTETLSSFPPLDEKAQRLRILVVDDVEGILQTLRAELTRGYHSVSTATSGERALELFQEHPYDVVVCDLAMSGMNGWEVGKEIKRRCEERNETKTPFVLLTGWMGQSGQEELMEEAGVDRIVEKPVRSPELLRLVREVVEEVKSRAGTSRAR